MKIKPRKILKLTTGQIRALDRLEMKLRFDVDIKNRIKTLRKKYAIKEGGYPELARKTIDSAPQQWMSGYDYETRFDRFNDLCIETNQLLNELGFIQRCICPSALLNYVYSNQLFQPGMDERSDERVKGLRNILSSYCISSICFYDAKSDRQEYRSATNSEDRESMDNFMDNLDSLLPVAIRVHPRASSNEVLADLAEAWAFIQSEYDYYLPERGKTPQYSRSKKDEKKERDELILEYTGKPNSDLLKAHAKKIEGSRFPTKKIVNIVRKRKGKMPTH